MQQPTDPLPEVIANKNVSFLIDASSGRWKCELVEQFFNPHEAQRILSIPLSNRNPKDRRICDSINMASSLLSRHISQL